MKSDTVLNSIHQTVQITPCLHLRLPHMWQHHTTSGTVTHVLLNKYSVITRSPCLTPVHSAPFTLTPLCQITPFLNLSSLIFGLTPFGRLPTGTNITAQNKILRTLSLITSVTLSLLCSSANVSYLHLFKYYFVLATNTANTRPTGGGD